MSSARQLIVCLALGASSPVMAHHSFATFDVARQVTLSGVVKDFQWTNPHTWVVLSVKGADGTTEDWQIEAGGVAGLKREGWTRDSFKPGDSATFTISPKKDGSHGGAFLQAKTASGQMLGSTTPITTVTAPTATPAPSGSNAR